MTASVEVDAPGEGKPLTRIRWLLKQLPDDRGELRIEAWYKMERYPVTKMLSEALENPQLLLSGDKKKPPRSFVVSQIGEMGTKRAGTKGSFTAQATELVIDFYREIVQPLKAWTPSAPKLRDKETPEVAEERREESIAATARESTSTPSDWSSPSDSLAVQQSP